MTPTNQASPALVFDDVTRGFAVPGGTTYPALERVTFAVVRGEFLAIVGPTGCGKSTLLNVAAGLLAPSAGAVRAFGTPLTGINRTAGYMFQADSLLPWLSAEDNVALGRELRGASRRDAKTEAEAWLARVGLNGHEQRYPHQLSGGMKKRVSLAQTLATEPKILLMDEPFSALDVQTRQLMENELLDIWSTQHTSVMFVTHDLEEAIALADRVVVLAAGPSTHPIAEFPVAIPRPRDVTELVHSEVFIETHKRIWDALKGEVLASYAKSKTAV